MEVTETLTGANAGVRRQRLDADIVCVGFGPATAGFLATLSKQLVNADGTPAVESTVMPGVPPQVLCYERADDIGFGVSGVVTKARALRATFPELDRAQIPMAAPVVEEKVLYLLDPHGASRRSVALRLADRLIRTFNWMLPFEEHALKLPWTPAFLHKHGGMVLSLGQFMQWVGAQVQSTGTVQIWPGTPIATVLLEEDNSNVAQASSPAGSAGASPGVSIGSGTLPQPAAGTDCATLTNRSRVVGVRLLDQGVDKKGNPSGGFTPGMDIRAALTVVGDGPVGSIGQQLDAHFDLPHSHHKRDWAVGMKFVVDLPENTMLKPGTVLHTLGYPEPEIFGFLYVHPDRVASLGIFVPSWFDSPARTAYRYLQHWMLHPYLWRYLQGGKLRSWGAKTLGESGRRGEPHLVGDGYARIGEGSGSTNVLTGSGVDEAWATGTQLAEAVLDLLKAKKPFTRQNLDETYVKRRRASWVEREALVAEKSRDGFQRGVVRGLIGMALVGLTNGKLRLGREPLQPWKRIPSLEGYYHGRITPNEIAELHAECAAKGVSLHDMVMDKIGWPAVPFDGRLLVSHQDALLMGGKVQAPPGFADHVVFLYPELCQKCGTKICIEMCSGQAITRGENHVPNFDREKCVHCGACLWNCAQPLAYDSERGNIAFRAGTGGLHSAEN
ncbi:MAG TPA: 4Fe-4S ferredoxin [Verrucomicrobiae bacterium]|nr:4Fe-4S ferredoxin [Verrucomicrobiae bacterium]